MIYLIYKVHSPVYTVCGLVKLIICYWLRYSVAHHLLHCNRIVSTVIYSLMLVGCLRTRRSMIVVSFIGCFGEVSYKVNLG